MSRISFLSLNSFECSETLKLWLCPWLWKFFLYSTVIYQYSSTTPPQCFPRYLRVPLHLLASKYYLSSSKPISSTVFIFAFSTLFYINTFHFHSFHYPFLWYLWKQKQTNKTKQSKTLKPLLSIVSFSSMNYLGSFNWWGWYQKL